MHYFKDALKIRFLNILKIFLSTEVKVFVFVFLFDSAVCSHFINHLLASKLSKFHSYLRVNLYGKIVLVINTNVTARSIITG